MDYSNVHVASGLQMEILSFLSYLRYKYSLPEYWATQIHLTMNSDGQNGSEPAHLLNYLQYWGQDLTIFSFVHCSSRLHPRSLRSSRYRRGYYLALQWWSVRLLPRTLTPSPFLITFPSPISVIFIYFLPPAWGRVIWTLKTPLMAGLGKYTFSATNN